MIYIDNMYMYIVQFLLNRNSVLTAISTILHKRTKMDMFPKDRYTKY